MAVDPMSYETYELLRDLRSVIEGDAGNVQILTDAQRVSKSYARGYRDCAEHALERIDDLLGRGFSD